MTSKCPGQNFRNLRVSLYRCPKCGASYVTEDIAIDKLAKGEKMIEEK